MRAFLMRNITNVFNTYLIRNLERQIKKNRAFIKPFENDLLSKIQR
jgi:hypothetical protein